MQGLNKELSEKEKEYSSLLKLLPVKCTNLQDHSDTKSQIQAKCAEIRYLRTKCSELVAHESMGNKKRIKKIIASMGGRSSKMFWTLAKSAESEKSINSLKKKDGTQTLTPGETL
jgi:hypothetical protein